MTTGQAPEWSMPFCERVLHRIDLRPGTRFLDVACGSGALAIPAARCGADVVAVDLTTVMDGAAFAFADDTFDVAASHNGVSLLPDLSGWLREMVRVTRPGGRVLIIAFGTPRKAECLRFLRAAVRASMPASTPRPTDVPHPAFRLASPSDFRQQLADAGLTDVQVDTVTWQTTFASASRFWDAVTSGDPVAVQLTAGLTDEQRTDVQQVLDGMFRERSGGRPGAVIHTEMNIGTGTK